MVAGGRRLVVGGDAARTRRVVVGSRVVGVLVVVDATVVVVAWVVATSMVGAAPTPGGSQHWTGCAEGDTTLPCSGVSNGSSAAAREP